MILILGGARSGKSRQAEGLAVAQGPVTYLATALIDPADAEMAARVERHRRARPPDWVTREVPRDLEGVLPSLVAREGSVVIDCVTLWISHLMLGLGHGPALDDETILATVDRAIQSARAGPARVIWVSNEVGSGVVPDHALARRFTDLQGWTNQRLAAACDQVILCVAGLAVRLKPAVNSHQL